MIDAISPTQGGPLSDVLIRDVPDDVLKAIDARAAKLGLSRVEYVRRRLAQDAATSAASVTVSDLRGVGEAFANLADPEVMSGAWIEAAYSARSGAQARAAVRESPLSAMPVEYLTPGIEDRAVEVQLLLADQGLHRAPSIPDHCCDR